MDATGALRAWIAGASRLPGLVDRGDPAARRRLDPGELAGALPLRATAPGLRAAQGRGRDHRVEPLARGGVPDSGGRLDRAGVRVPEPVGFCTDPAVVGAPFALMGLVEGVGLGPRIAKDLSLGGDREQPGGASRARACPDPREPRRRAIRRRRRSPSWASPSASPARAEIRALARNLDGIGARAAGDRMGPALGASAMRPDCPDADPGAPGFPHRQLHGRCARA